MNSARLWSVLMAATLSGCLSKLPPPAMDPMIGSVSAGSPESEPTSADPSPSQPWRSLPVKPLVWTAPLLSGFADTLRPGVVVFWVEDSSLPLASIRFAWPEGRLGLSPAQDAAAAILGQVLRRGGTTSHAPNQVDDTLEFLASGISVSLGMVRTTANVSGLSADLPFLVQTLGDMLVSPRLDTARLSSIKSERIQDIEHRFDTPAQVQGLVWDRVVNGPGPWTRLADSTEVRRLDRMSLLDALRGRFSGQKVWISVAGRVDRARLRNQLLAFLERLDRSPFRSGAVARLDTLPALPPLAPPGVWLYDIAGNQAQIRLGGRFVRRDHPDYYPLVLACEVLGSGFGSRLVDRIRSDEGLAYHVGSFAGSDYDRPGTWGVVLQTKTPSTGRALDLVGQEIRKLADSGFHPGELDRARKGLSASVPSLFDSPEATADLVLESAAWGRRDDHFRRYLRALDTIPDSTVLRVFRKWFRPESLRVTIAGSAKDLMGDFPDGSPRLSTYGPLHRWNADSLMAR